MAHPEQGAVGDRGHPPGKVLKPLVRLGKDPDDCWTWLGVHDVNGYPRKQFHGQSLMARRWIWEQLFGPLPPRLEVFDTCGNRGCTNPHHLRAGSHSEACAEGAGGVLTPMDVAAIRRVDPTARSRAMAMRLAAECGCSYTTVYDVWARNTHHRRQLNPPERELAHA